MIICHYKNNIRVAFACIILIIVGLMLHTPLLAQNIKGRPEVVKEKDTKLLDSLNKVAADSVRLAHKGALTQVVDYSSIDSLVYDFGDTDTVALMYKGVKVKSEDLELESDFLEMNRRLQTLFATGVYDTTNVIVGKPVFKQGGGEYKMDTLTYNYKSKKARILNVITQDGEGYLHGGVTKRLADNSTFIKNGKYTTCDHEHPHFYLQMSRGKVVDGDQKKIVFGPSYMVLEDVPLYPLMLPFGFFPQLSKRSSGIKFPTYGEEVERGFFLDNLGVYIAVGDYMDLDILGSIYSLGSWSIRSSSKYVKRYKFTGGFNLEYNFNVFGERGSTDYRENKTFAIRWNHSQSPKARPGTTFSASVNFSSIKADRYNNQRDPFRGLNNTANSSISYAKTWEGTPLSFSTNFTHSQNMSDSTYDVTIPDFTFVVNRISPFKSDERVGKKKLYEDISFAYNTSFRNQVHFKASEVGQSGFMEKFNNGMRHKLDINLPSFSFFKYVNFSPVISHAMNWYFKSKEKHWDAEQNKVVEQSTKAFSEFGVTNDYSFGASMDTRVYGMLQFKEGSMIRGIRHMISPSIGLNYTPDLRTYANGWRTLQSGPSVIDNITDYNIYEGQVNAPPSSFKSGAISLTLRNTLEMKVRDRKDTTAKGGYKKISILDNFNISTSYNLLADSLNLSNINVSAATNVLGKLGLSFNASFDPYMVNEKGQRINRFYWAEHGGLNFGELRSFSTSFGYSFSGGDKNESGKKATGDNADNNLSGIRDANMQGNGNMLPQQDNTLPMLNDPFTYQDFNVPWSLTFSYTYSYNKSWTYINNVLKPNANHVQTLNFGGSVAPTKNWNIRFNSGYDFRLMKLTQTQVTLTRDLHCFNFSFSWVPNGILQSWNFKIAITSSMLSSILKYDKQSSPWDNQ